MSYEQLLEQAYGKVKSNEKCDLGRWEIPSANSLISGSKTTLNNFSQICSYLRRDCAHLMKFLSNELASFSKIENERLVFNRKISNEKFNEKIKLYACKYVLCQECKKPDTELVKENGFLFIKCLACGAKRSLGRA